MATHGWRKTGSVEEWLFAEGHEFDFYQAVKLLEIIYPHRLPVGEGDDPGRTAVQFGGKTGLDFPPGEIAEIRRPEREDRPAGMFVNFMSLTGALGPVPQAHTELLLERIKARDTAMRDFLDIFNHRLVSLMYRARKTLRPAFEFKSPEKTHFAGYLFSLAGLGTPGIRGHMRVNDRVLLPYAGLLAIQARSMTGLETILRNHFQVAVRGENYIGRWRWLEDDQRTVIGKTGQNRVLGDGVTLGARIWDCQGKFRLCLGPLTLHEFLNFLPIGKGYTSLCEIVRFYTRSELDFDIRLTLKAAEIPVTRLSSRHGSRLGWASWLKTREFRSDDSRVILSPETIDAETFARPVNHES